MGGTIKLVTNQPDPKAFAANVEVIGSGTTNGGGFNHTENVMLNIPLMQDVAALRLVGTDKYIDGWIDRKVLNPFPPEVNGSTARGDVAGAPVAEDFRHSNTEHLQAGRATLLIQPTDRLSITLGFMHQSLTQDGPSTIDSPPLTETHYQPFDVSEPFADKFNLYTLTGKFNFDSFQLVSASAYWDRQQNQTQDISEAMQDYIGGFFGPPAAFPYSSTATVTEGGSTFFGLGAGSITEDDYTRQFSEELRLASTGPGPLQWLVGGYYSSFGATSHVFSFYPDTNDGFNANFGTTNLADNHRKVDIDQYAAFGEVSYMLPDNLKASVGARYYQYHSNSVTSVSGVSANGTSDPLFGLAQNSGVTPKVDLAYIPDDNTTVYGTVSKGFRPGGPNSPIPGSSLCVGSSHSVRSGQRLELRTGRETAVLRFTHLGQWSRLLRGLDQRAAASGSELRLQVHRECGQGQGVRCRTRSGRGADAGLRAVAERRLHSRDELDHTAGRRRRGGTAAPGRTGGDRQHGSQLQAAVGE